MLLFQLSMLLVLSLLFLATPGSAGPLYYRSPLNSLPAPTSASPVSTTSSSASQETTSLPIKSPGRKNISDVDLSWMWEGNQEFQAQKEEIAQDFKDAPGILFIGCSDTRFSPEVIFQTDAGRSTSHLNLGNQFSSQDLSSTAAISYAIQELKVKHVVIIGHYGCKSVEKATSQLSDIKNSAIQRWMQPVADLYSRSKRFEIRRLRALRKGSNFSATAKATPDGLRALVEENVKAGVQNLYKELMPLLSEEEVMGTNLYGHGLVFDEETGEVKDLGVSFGPAGKPIVQVPFDMVPKARMHIPFGKFEAKAKKKDPVMDSDSKQAAFVLSGSSES